MKKNYILSFCLISLSLFTFAQPEQVLDINDGSGNSSPNNLFVFNGAIYFGADDSSGSNTPGGLDLGRELWTSDGTTVGTSFVSDLRTGDASSSPGNFFEFNGTLYFSANSGAGNVLFSSDGTETGTNATGDGFVFNPTELDGLVYYVDTTTGNSLNEFNGTGTSLVSGSGVESLVGAVMIAYQNKIFCYMDESTDEPTIGRELYAYDPALDTFSLIKDITGDNGDSGISNFTILGVDLYFEALGALWKTDGTNAGTIAISAAATAGIGGVNNLYAWDGKLFFEGDDGNGDQLWVYDPTTDNVTNLSNLSGGSNSNHDPSDFAEINGWLYYRGEDSNDTDGHLWRTDGTATFQLDDTIKDIDDIIVFNNILYFEADDDNSGNELYSFDPATLSIDRVSFNEFSIYPNPSKHQITIDYNFTTSVDYKITDLDGRVVLEGKLTDNVIKHQLTSGLYLLQLNTADSSLTKKIIVN